VRSAQNLAALIFVQNFRKVIIVHETALRCKDFLRVVGSVTLVGVKRLNLYAVVRIPLCRAIEHALNVDAKFFAQKNKFRGEGAKRRILPSHLSSRTRESAIRDPFRCGTMGPGSARC